MGLIVKGVLAVFWLLFVPFAAGIGFYQKKEQRQLKNPGVCLLTGYTILFMGMEILTLPMIFFKLPLHVLVAAYGCFALALAVYGSLALGRRKRSISEKLAASGKRFSWEMTAAILLILFMWELPQQR